MKPKGQDATRKREGNIGENEEQVLPMAKHHAKQQQNAQHRNRGIEQKLMLGLPTRLISAGKAHVITRWKVDFAFHLLPRVLHKNRGAPAAGGTRDGLSAAGSFMENGTPSGGGINVRQLT